MGNPSFYLQVYVRIAGAIYDFGFDNKGLKDIDFRRVDYDVESELQLARDLKLPYYEVYYESLVNGIHHTHNQDLLHEIAQSQGHDVELDDWLSRNS